MIAKLTGMLDDSGPDWAVIDVAGVGYLVHCSAKTLAALGIRGDVATVHTELQVSENDMRLIGFASGTEREWFRLLTGVQGVGSKMALAVLSALSIEELQRACAGGDAAQVARAQGVGPKLAARIVNELKDRAGVMPALAGGRRHRRAFGRWRAKRRRGLGAAEPGIQAPSRQSGGGAGHRRTRRGRGTRCPDPDRVEESGAMMRLASCQCGQLSAQCEGEPIRISVCHCLACQTRSGSAFAAQARFRAEQVRIAGESTEWVRTADSGNQAVHHFCPVCGSTVWYQSRPHADAIAIPVGAFADPAFPAPRFSVWEERKHGWVAIAGEGIEHFD